MVVKTAAFTIEWMTLLNATFILFQSRVLLPFPGLYIALIQNYFSVLKTQSKMRTYVRYKHEFSMEPYITKLHFKARQQISKLRLSDHNLEIERGRYHRPCLKPEDEHVCFVHKKLKMYFTFLLSVQHAVTKDKTLTKLYNTKFSKHSFIS